MLIGKHLVSGRGKGLDMRKLKSKSASKGVRRSVKKGAARKPKRYSQQTGKITGGAAKALGRRDRLIEKYTKDGMKPGEARAKATAEMRDNNKKDWRR